MPDYFNNGRCDYSKFDSMTTEELEEILRQDAQNLEGDTDIDMLMYITEVIRKREKPNPNMKTPDEAFEIFKTIYLPKAIAIREAIHNAENQEATRSGSDASVRSESTGDKGKVISMPRRMRRLVSAAAVVVLLLAGSLTVQAVGPEIWRAVLRWTEDTFYFDRDQQPTSGNLISTGPTDDGEREYQSLQEALEAHNITIPLVPTWFPEGYEVADIKVSRTSSIEQYLGVYAKDDQKIVVQIYRSTITFPLQMEQSSMLEMYKSGDRVYYIYENDARLSAAWIMDNYECYISGEVTIDEMKSMIDSIEE